MTLSSYEAYFTNIKNSFTKLNEFYHIDMIDEFDNFIADLRNTKYKTPLLILESYTLSTIAQKLDNLHDNFDGALVVLDRYDIRSMTPTDKTAFIADKEFIIKQIRRKMLNDKMRHHPLMDGLVAESIKIEKTETIAGAYKGFRLTFSIEAPDNDQLNTNYWL